MESLKAMGFAQKVKDMVEQLFAGWKSQGKLPKAPSSEPDFIQPRENIMKKQVMQTQIMLGWLGTTLFAPDQPAVEVMTEILSGMSGRLFVRLRDQKSLAYEVNAIHLEGLERGFIAGYIGCAPVSYTHLTLPTKA